MSGLLLLLTGAAWIGGTILSAFCDYGLMRRIALPCTVGETRDLAGAIMFRIAALHGLVLALVFAQELGQVGEIRLAGDREAALVADIYHDLRRYDAGATEPIRTAMGRDAVAVVDAEWDAPRTERALSQAAWTQWEAAYEAILDLAPAPPGRSG